MNLISQRHIFINNCFLVMRTLSEIIKIQAQKAFSRAHQRMRYEARVQKLKLKQRRMRKKFIKKIRKFTTKNMTQLDKKKLSQKLQKFVEAKHDELETISTSSLSCPLCLDILINPTMTTCGHIFCFKCIEQLLMRQAICPVCRTNARVQELSRKTHFQNINDIIWKKSKKCKEYADRKQENLNWLQNRFIKSINLRIGDIIDVRDTQYIWCKAKVLKISKDDNEEMNFITVHYLGWNSIYDQAISIKSQRIAPLNFFTKRTDIPHYELGDPNEQNYRCRIDYGATSREIFDPSRRERNNMVEQQPHHAIRRLNNRITEFSFFSPENPPRNQPYQRIQAVLQSLRQIRNISANQRVRRRIRLLSSRSNFLDLQEDDNIIDQQNQQMIEMIERNNPILYPRRQIPLSENEEEGQNSQVIDLENNQEQQENDQAQNSNNLQ